MQRARVRVRGRRLLSPPGLAPRPESGRHGAGWLPGLPLPRLRIRRDGSVRRHAQRPGTEDRPAQGAGDPGAQRHGVRLVERDWPAALLQPAGGYAGGRRVDQRRFPPFPTHHASRVHDGKLRGSRPPVSYPWLSRRSRGGTRDRRWRAPGEPFRFQAREVRLGFAQVAIRRVGGHAPYAVWDTVWDTVWVSRSST